MQSRNRSGNSPSSEHHEPHENGEKPAYLNGGNSASEGGEGDLDNNDGPPSKRRKLNGSTTPKPTLPSRHPSPPWRRIAVEGPTSFVEGGRRKSSRTNLVPLELQPPSEKRQTRSKLNTPAVAKSRYGGAAFMSAKSPESTSSHPVNGTRRQSFGGKRISTGQHGVVQSPGQSRGSVAPKSPSTKRAFTSSTPAKPRTPTKAPAHAAKARNPHHTRRSARASELAAAKRQQGAEADDPSDDFSSPEPADVDPNARTPRLKFRVKMPKVPIQHPGHVLPPRKYLSFHDWLDSDDPLAGENVRRTSSEDARKEARLHARIIEEGQPGGLLSQEKCGLYMPDTQDEPDRQYAHQDHLVAQGVHFRALLAKERRRQVIEARRLAYAAQAKWKLQQPKTREEIHTEQIEVSRARYKQVKKDLQMKWDMVATEVNKRRLIRWEEQQQVLGKQALNDMLEQSTLLLDARRAQQSSEPESDATSEQSGSEGSDADRVENDIQQSEDGYESNMSTTDSESEGAAQSEVADDDVELTVEQLRQKYASLPEDRERPASYGPGSDVEPERFRSRMDIVDPTAESEVDGQDGTVELEQVDEALLDDSDESTNMSDDMGDSDEEEEIEEGDADETDAEEAIDGEEHGSGLLGFLAPKDRVAPAVSEVGEEQAEPAEDGNDVEAKDKIVELRTSDHPASPIPTFEIESKAKIGESSKHDESLPLDADRVSNGLSRQLTPGTNVTSRPSDVDSATSSDLHGASQHPSSTTTPQPSYNLKTPIPSVLLRGTLREYQHYGLDWLAGLYANGNNGILADEMGLGKTIQTIALLAHLASVHHVWGPHLIVVPTSVMLNWEMEFKKWCPGFKILTYYGTQEERKQKRKGWMDNDLWHVCITSYQLVLQDQHAFKRRQWHYMVLDEAHHIKNFRSQRWQTLLTFRTRARLLLTGTPLQNNLTELWSLLFFLMPADSAENGIGGFADLQEFSNWFKRPVEQILEHGRETMDDEAKTIVGKLHKLLRPYLLRRMKADVEKQMPAKIEHVYVCRTSKRQRQLYNEFMSRAHTKEAFASGTYLSVINCLMQLRKVCNHPDLFETRQIVTSFAMPKSVVADYEIKELLVRKRLLRKDSVDGVDLNFTNLTLTRNEGSSLLSAKEGSRLQASSALEALLRSQHARVDHNTSFDGSTVRGALNSLLNDAKLSRHQDLEQCVYTNKFRSQRFPIHGSGLIELLSIGVGLQSLLKQPKLRKRLLSWFSDESTTIRNLVPELKQRSRMMESAVQKFGCLTPKVVATDLTPLALTPQGVSTIRRAQEICPEDNFHEARTRLSIAFPDKRLLQYDCGKLQRLDQLLRYLQTNGHRALIFTQMTKVLDILEQFLNIHGHRYLRLDGSTKVEQRQVLTERFNNDNRILAFILSSRSGGLGINLTGADSVIFYDLDWNPAMDKQCQDRCHRIGQTRDVHIYRFVSEDTIEANILRKANQKRMLDDVVIQEGEFTTDYFNRLSIRDMLGDDAPAVNNENASANSALDRVLGVPGGSGNMGKVLEQVEDSEDKNAAKAAEKELVTTDDADFDDTKSPHDTGTASTPKTPAGPSTPREAIPPPLSSTSTTAPTLANPAAIESIEVSTTLAAETSGLRTPGAAPADPEAIPVDDVPDGDGDGDDDESTAVHIDEYMLRFMEWDLRDVPVDVPLDKTKAKTKGKNAHRGKGWK